MWPFDSKAPAQPAQAPQQVSFGMTCAADVGTGVQLPVFPILMAEAWQRAPTQVCRPVITGVKLPRLPVVALVYLIPQPGTDALGRAYLRQERIDSLGKSTRDFEQEALHNLALRTATWRRFSPAPGVDFAVCSDDYLAAERLLDPAFLGQAQTMLGEDSLVVAVPARGQLHAARLSLFTSGKHNAQALAFKGLAEQMFAQAGEVGITPWPFIVVKGRINSVLELG